MGKYDTGHIRNTVLLSHTGAGKTSLSEAMLFNSGAVTRLGKVDEENTTSDYDPEEIKRKISINLSLLSFERDGVEINLIDTPGYADFVGEVKAGLQAVDSAIILVCAVSGVEVGTELTWKYATEMEIPRIIFINKMDRENADFKRVIAQIESTFGRQCVPLQIPLGSEKDFKGVADLITMKEVPESLKDEAQNLHEKLIEAVAEIDDELTLKYLEGEGLNEEDILTGLKSGIASNKIVPILVGSALQNKGVIELLDVICKHLPSSEETGRIEAQNSLSGEKEELEAEENSPLAAYVFKTMADPRIGKLTYLRVHSGVLSSNSTAWNASKKCTERLGQLYKLRGKTQEPVERLIAGDIGVVAKLAETGTNDTLSTQEHPLILEPIQFPFPSLSVAVHPKTKADIDKLSSAVARLTEEDPTLSIHREPDTGETILSGLGETHLDVVRERMKQKFGVDVELKPPKIPYKETLTTKVETEYKHKKQTGGHGQYAHVFLRLEPLERGAGFEFADEISGGVVPKNYIPSVEKGVREALKEGVLAHYPIADIKVTLYYGSYHPVDSSDMAFQIAGASALRKGFPKGNPVLVEPIMNVRVTVPESFTGDVMNDLNGRRARVLGMSPESGMNVIEAQAPLAEMLSYSTGLRSIAQGRGFYTMEFSHYEEVPAYSAQKIIAERDAERKKS